jgi:hypothetical protein
MPTVWPAGRRRRPCTNWSGTCAARTARRFEAIPISAAILWRSDQPRYRLLILRRHGGQANDECCLRQFRIIHPCLRRLLTRLVSRCRPRKTATIGIRPVLLRTWKRQRFRDRCHDRSGAQGCNVRRQRENARTAYYDHGKREKDFLRKTHLLTHCLICLSALNAPFRRFVGVINSRQRFQDGCVRDLKWLLREQKQFIPKRR